jgi:hypothetical protein
VSFVEQKYNESATYQNVIDATVRSLRGKFIASLPMLVKEKYLKLMTHKKLEKSLN